MATQLTGGLVGFALVLQWFCFFSTLRVYDIIKISEGGRKPVFFAPVLYLCGCIKLRCYKHRRGSTPDGAPACPNAFFIVGRDGFKAGYPLFGGDAMRNFVRLKRFSLLYSHYAYVDLPDYLADGMFEKHKVHVSFGNEYINQAHNYKVIFAKCPKWESQRFEAAMKGLVYLMALGGHSNYEEVCKLLVPKNKRYCRIVQRQDSGL